MTRTVVGYVVRWGQGRGEGARLTLSPDYIGWNGIRQERAFRFQRRDDARLIAEAVGGRAVAIVRVSR